MSASPIIGASEGSSFSDWKLIDKLTKDHVLTKIKVCTDTFDRNVFGLQLTYGGFTESGAALEEVPLDSHGIIDEGGIVKCDEKVLAQGEYVQDLRFGFTSTDLVTFAYQISNSYNKLFGTTTSST